MPIENTIQFGAAQAANRPAVQPEAAPAEASKPTAVLDGPNVRVSVTGTQLDKLVAKVKSESEDARLDAAKRRIAIVLIALRTLNLQMTESQKNGLAQLEVLQGQLDSLSDLLNGKTSNLSAAELRAAELQAKIEELTKAVENAVEEGKEHRKQVEELKRTRAEDDAELRAAEDALAKAEAAITAAQENLKKAQSDLATAKASIESIKSDIAGLKSQISGIEKKISECVAAVGDKALSALAAALRSDATSSSAPEIRETNSDREKEEEKEYINDPLRIIREALDRMDEDIRRTIDDNQTMLV